MYNEKDFVKLTRKHIIHAVKKETSSEETARTQKICAFICKFDDKNHSSGWFSVDCLHFMRVYIRL